MEGPGFFLSACLVVYDGSTFHSRLPQIYEELYHTVNNADHEKDLKWWSFNYGVNMGMNWPQFEVRMRRKKKKRVWVLLLFGNFFLLF